MKRKPSYRQLQADLNAANAEVRNVMGANAALKREQADRDARKQHENDVAALRWFVSSMETCPLPWDVCLTAAFTTLDGKMNVSMIPVGQLHGVAAAIKRIALKIADERNSDVG